MSSTDGEGERAEEDTISNAPGVQDGLDTAFKGSPQADESSRTGDLQDELYEATEGYDVNGGLAAGFDGSEILEGNGYQALLDLSLRQKGDQAASPRSSISAPDDTPSPPGSFLSSPGSSIIPSATASSRVQSPRIESFDRRFHSRLSPVPIRSQRAVSPNFLNSHSRSSSVSSNVPRSQQDEAEAPQTPWEVVRWTRLRKISTQAFSEAAKRSFGRPTCIVVSTYIAIGTSKGIILVFDYHQTLKSIIGQGTKALECGSITSLAISADYSTIAGGHANGSIFTWEIARPAKPFLQIFPMSRASLEQRTSDGHVLDNAIMHVGFLGTRHTALVSADHAGMAFSHLATRGLGAVGRTVKTTRLLGRYTDPESADSRPRKPSSVLAFSPLLLGNVERSTDSLGLTALLTPYLLVVVSTTPIAQTQHKAPRPRGIAAHGALSGCLAWFPAVKLKNSVDQPEESTSKTKLVYCWSNVLTVLDLDEIQPVEPSEKPETPNLNFRARSRWHSEESIVAVQWLSRSVLAVLTITQRLVILEDNSLRVTDSSDLMQKHVYHQDLFSRQLQPVVEHVEGEDDSMHGVIADAFYMSFRTYKERLFLLGFNDVSIGTLSNWAARLLALMEAGDYLAAIQLAISFYEGKVDKLIVGLPDDDTARHDLVQEKLLELISASLKYTFGDGQRQKLDLPDDKPLEELARLAFDACLMIDNLDFLFGDVYEWYDRGSVEHLYFAVLEEMVLKEKIRAIPPNVLKALITYYMSEGWPQRLEDIFCHLSTETFDIDQITTLCRQHLLYDALIYVWNDALHDYVTPLVELLSLIRLLDDGKRATDDQDSPHLASALKVFPYLAYVLTSRKYPSGAPLEAEIAVMAKTDLYGFLFSGVNLAWPKAGGSIIRTERDGEEEPPYPYLNVLLKFDTGSFLSMLNEAFEDSYLNENDQTLANGQSAQQAAHVEININRRKVINILLSVMRPPNFTHENIIFLNMFIARSLSKFSQFLELPGSIVRQVLVDLCKWPSPTVADDCQLSVEYLLSVYHPPDLQSLIPLFAEAHFYRVLKQVYRAQRQYPELLETFFLDPENKQDVFDCVRDCLRPNAGLSKKQVDAVKRVIKDNATDLAEIDTVRTAQCLKANAPELLETVLDALGSQSEKQFVLLRTLLEPDTGFQEDAAHQPDVANGKFVETYVRLMCKFDSTHVADYVGTLDSGNLRLDEVLPAIEKRGIVDAAVVLLTRDGLVREALSRLITHLATLESAIMGLVEAAARSPNPHDAQETADDLLDAVSKYQKVGIWLCQGQARSNARSKAIQKSTQLVGDISEDDLTADELLWLDLVDALVCLSQHVNTTVRSSAAAADGMDTAKIVQSLRAMVQQTFTSLLASTTDKAPDQQQPASSPRNDMTFLRILRAFLNRASRASPSLSDLRAVLADLFSAYAFEENILSLANRFLDKDLFVHVREANRLRQRGWRPRGHVCEGCRRRVWGPGAGGHVWDAWERRQACEEARRLSARVQRGGDEAARGKGKATAGNEFRNEAEAEAEAEDDGGDEPGVGGLDQREGMGPLVLFSCRHVYHRKCLERAQAAQGMGEFRCPLCR